jgi:peptidyl-prolyl cis-trans isomerase B (cyclophilin B)
MIRFLLKKSSLIILFAAGLIGIMFFFSSNQKPKVADNGKKPYATIHTAYGAMKIELWPDVAPKTVENFVKLSKQGFYDGTAFHRIVAGFMIQGGDPLTKDPANAPHYGTGGPGYTIRAEFNDRPHVRGVISMARSSDPHSAGSQFFICHGDARFLDRQYTAFGKLVSGDDVLERIAQTPTSVGPGGEKSQPLERIEIVRIEVSEQ